MGGKGVSLGPRREGPCGWLLHLLFNLGLGGLGYGVATQRHLYEGYTKTPNVGEDGVDCALEPLRLWRVDGGDGEGVRVTRGRGVLTAMYDRVPTNELAIESMS